MTPTGKLATGLMAVVAAAAFTLGVPGLLWAGSLAALPTVLRPGVPVVLDCAIAIFGLAAVARRTAGQAARFAWTALGALTTSSMALQVAHVLTVKGATGAPAVIGASLAAAFPALVFASTHVILELAVAPAPTKSRRRATAATPAPASEPVSPSPHQSAVTLAATPAAKAPKKPKVDPAQVMALTEQGLSRQAVADQLGTSKPTVVRIVARERGIAA